MEAFLSSTVAVAIAELGDKTQLLTLFLVSRFAQRYAVVAGMLLATILNHLISALLGDWLVDVVPEQWVGWVVGLSFIAIGCWLLIPDKDDGNDERWLKRGAFIATFVLFFVAEVGDKTQLATIVLAARYHEVIGVVAGTTLGVMLANLPVVLFGGWILSKLPMKWVRWLACALFLILGGITLIELLR